MFYFIIATAIIGSFTIHTVRACQELGVGCSKDWTCCSGLQCTMSSGDWGFCQKSNKTGTHVTGPPSSLAVTGATSMIGEKTSPRSSTVLTITQNASQKAHIELTPTVSSATSEKGPVCQDLGVGCSANWRCCEGLSCVIDVDIWGFCQNFSDVATNVTDSTTVPSEITVDSVTKYDASAPSNVAVNLTGALITKSEFVNAVTTNQYPVPTDAQFDNFISRATPSGQIASKRELAMFLANILLESDGLRAKSEYNPPANWYVYRAMDVPGQKYYGRGYIQLSWSYNYGAASKALYGDNRLLTNANQVATNETIAWDVSFWYWSTNVHNQPGISEGKFGVSIKAINGGLECGPNALNKASPRRRFDIYKKVYAAFGIPGTPDERGCWN